MLKRQEDNERSQDRTVYVGNLDEKVTESLLYELMIQVAPVKHIHLPKDRILRTHQGYGFVELRNSSDVEYVEKVMSGVRLFDKVLKVNKVAHGHNSNSNSGGNNDIELGSTLFIKNLDELVDENLLFEIFKKFGKFHKPPTIVRNEDGESRRFGFIYYKNFKDSDEALAKMNNQFILNNKVSIDYSFKKQNGKMVKHGDEVERLLLNEAEKNNYDL